MIVGHVQLPHREARLNQKAVHAISAEKRHILEKCHEIVQILNNFRSKTQYNYKIIQKTCLKFADFETFTDNQSSAPRPLGGVFAPITDVQCRFTWSPKIPLAIEFNGLHQVCCDRIVNALKLQNHEEIQNRLFERCLLLARTSQSEVESDVEFEGSRYEVAEASEGGMSQNEAVELKDEGNYRSRYFETLNRRH